MYIHEVWQVLQEAGIIIVHVNQVTCIMYSIIMYTLHSAYRAGITDVYLLPLRVPKYFILLELKLKII